MGAGFVNAQDGCVDPKDPFDTTCGSFGEVVINSNTGGNADGIHGFGYYPNSNWRIATIYIREDWNVTYYGLQRRDLIRVGPGVDLTGNMRLDGGVWDTVEVGDLVEIFYNQDMSAKTRRPENADLMAAEGDGTTVTSSGTINFGTQGKDKLWLRSEFEMNDDGEILGNDGEPIGNDDPLPESQAGDLGIRFDITSRGRVNFSDGTDDSLVLEAGTRLHNSGGITFGAGADMMDVNGWISGAGTIGFSAGGTISFVGSKVDNTKNDAAAITPDGTIRIDNHVTLGSGKTVIADTTKIDDDGGLTLAGDATAGTLGDQDVLALAVTTAKGFQLKEFTLGTGQVDILAKSATEIKGGEGTYNIYLGAILLDSDLDPPAAAISLGGGSTSEKMLKVGSNIPAGATITGVASQKDTVHITGGAGIVNLGDGANELTIGIGSSTGTYSGTYTGGAGIDTITVNSGSKVSGTLDLGDGNDTVEISSGASVSGTLGLGAGNNRVEAMGSITGSVTGGGGSDDIILFGRTGGTTASTLNASIGNLGAGANTLWIPRGVGVDGTTSRPLKEVKLSVAAGATNTVGNTIRICRDVVNIDSASGASSCSPTDTLSNTAFDVELDAAANFEGNWKVDIDAPGTVSNVQSRLSVIGNVTLENPEIPNFMLARNLPDADRTTLAGDRVTVTGTYNIRDYNTTTNAGTLFELDVDPAANSGAGAVDKLVFSATGPANSVTAIDSLSINLVFDASAEPSNAFVATDIVEVTSTLTLGLEVFGGAPTGTPVTISSGGNDQEITVNGHRWTLAVREDGATSSDIFSIDYKGPDLVSFVISDPEYANIASGEAENYSMVTVRADWENTFTGHDGTDKIVVDDGYTTSGAFWNLGAGDDEVWGAADTGPNSENTGPGSIGGRLDMGAGNDKIGVLDPASNPSPAAVAAARSLSLGVVNLGGGDNDMWAARATEVRAEADDTVATDIEGNDMVYLKPRANFTMTGIDLGDGTNNLWIIGDTGDAASRAVTIPLIGVSGVTPAASATNTLTVCGWYDTGCATGTAPSGGDHAFNVTLDASPDPLDAGRVNIWDTITVNNTNSSEKSMLQVKGDVTLTASTLVDTKIAGDGVGGDSVTLSGRTEVDDGTQFELDAVNGSGDRLVILENSWPVGSDGNPVGITLMLKGTDTPQNSQVGDKFTVLEAQYASGSLPGSVEIGGEFHHGAITIDGRVWDLLAPQEVTDTSSSVTTTSYVLEELGEGTLDFFVDDPKATDNVEARLSFKSVTVQTNWSGSFNAYEGQTGTKVDNIIVDDGASTSGTATWALSGGNNMVTVKASGSIGADTTITMGGGGDTVVGLGTIAGNISMGAGDNTVKGSGTISGGVTMGGGNDTIGNFDAQAPDADNMLKLSGNVDLGDGRNRVRAMSATSITGGSGNDDLQLRPGTGDYSSSLTLGGGENKVWLGGGTGKVTLSLNGDKPAGASNALYLCNTGFAGAGCGSETASSFNAVLNASGTSLEWDMIKVHSAAGGARSALEIHGSASLNDPHLESISVSTGDGANDSIDITGSYTLQDPLSSGSLDLSVGTLFDLDLHLNGVSDSSADSLSFDGATATAGSSKTPYIRLAHTVTRRATSGRMTLVTIDSGSDVEGIRVVTGSPGSETNALVPVVANDIDEGLAYTIGDDTWRIYGRQTNIARTYYIGFNVGERARISDDILANQPSKDHTGSRYGTTVVGTWTGKFTGYAEEGLVDDDIIVEAGVTASTGDWNLNDGDDVITGSGTITSKVDMGAGNDRIGTQDGDLESGLTLDWVVLGGPVSSEINQVYAKSARRIDGSDGVDIISLQSLGGGGDDPGIDLGGGTTYNSVTVMGSIQSGIKSEASNRDQGDTVEIGGGTGDVDLADGLNIMKVNGNWSGNYGGQNGGRQEDRVTVASGASATGEIILGAGNDTFESLGDEIRSLDTGAGNDTVRGIGASTYATGLGEVELGAGNDTLHAAGFKSLDAGGGDDLVYIGGSRTSMSSMSLSLGGDKNTVWMTGGLESSPDILQLKEDGDNTLYLCNGGFSATGCAADVANGSPFHVILNMSSSDQTNPNFAWSSVNVHAAESQAQSSLAVRGSLTLADANMESLEIKSNGLAGDEIVITGEYRIGESSSPTDTVDLSAGTVFTLDAVGSGNTLTADELRFGSVQSAARSGTGDVYPVVSIAASGSFGGLVPASSRVEMVKVLANSTNVAGIRVFMSEGGSQPRSFGDAITAANSQTKNLTVGSGNWRISREEDGSDTAFFLDFMGFAGFDPGSECDDISGANNDRLVVTKAWCGNFNGTEKVEVITVNLADNVKAGSVSGYWNMESGNDEIKGSGTVRGTIRMGGGDDTIGNPTIEGDSVNKLVFEGPVELGEGTNMMNAISAMGVTGGAGSDTILLQTLGSGARIHVGGGSTGNKVTIRSNFEGTILSDANGSDQSNMDEVVLGDASATPDNLTGTVNLGGGVNSLTVIGGTWDGQYIAGPGADIINLMEGATVNALSLGGGDNEVNGDPTANIVEIIGGKAKINLMGGNNRLTARTTEVTEVTTGGGNDFVLLEGGARELVNLGEGTNMLITAGVLDEGYRGGSGRDWISFRGKAEVTGDAAEFDLGGGNNLVLTEAHHANNEIVKLDLGKFTGGGNKTMLICGGKINPGQNPLAEPNPPPCVSDEGTGFHVELDVTNDSGWQSIMIENYQSSGRANVVVKSDVSKDFVFGHGSKFGNARISGDGKINDITMNGDYEFTESTVFVLDIAKQADGTGNRGDRLILTGDDYKSKENRGPHIDIQVASGGIDESDASPTDSRIILVRAPVDENIGYSRRNVQMGSRLWRFDSAPNTSDPTINEHYFYRTRIDLNQQMIPGWHVSSAVSGLTAFGLLGGAPNPGLTPPGQDEEETSQSRPDSDGTPVWAYFTSGGQTEQVKLGTSTAKPEVEQSFWMLNSGSEFYAQNLESSRITHSVLVQYGNMESKLTSGGGSSVETSALGFGYSGELLGESGAYGRLSAMSSQLSGDSGGSFSVSGTLIAAEAGWSFLMGGGNSSSMFLTPSAKYVTAQFGDLSLPSGNWTGLENSTADVGMSLNYETLGVDSNGRPSSTSFFGGFNYSQNLSGGFSFNPKTEKGEDTLSVAVDTEKNWLTLEGGLSFRRSWWEWKRFYGRIKFSAANANGADLAGSRQSVSMGFDVEW